ncbi:Bug family tripartite tricarboxylate transporter substrate binding protein [Sabulicella rubraurantiaca]|uniref:Bug family tripartite tricarboxylate transporter substrate binding protein n=1 Tax=Sabulicella rubraurantiaca TaxID=2811429 RepID=UPI001A95F728|nr:tripartite tricarboxylate transporter substrate binding protein [Sabulicella rubraurantiaca]
MIRRSMLSSLAAIAAVAATGGRRAEAQAWPNRPIRVVVTYAPGGSSDISIRSIAQGVGERLGQGLVVENRAGANGSIGMEAVARAPADGHTFAVTADSAVFQTLLKPTYPYDVARDFEPVSLLVSQPIVIAVHPSLGVRSLTELVAKARRDGEELPYVLSGIGGTHHLAAALFAEQMGIKLTPVSYRGGGQAINDLVGGQVKLGFLGSSPVLPHARERRLRIIGVTSAQRSTTLPDVPTVAEALGLADYGLDQWFCMLAPRGTPEEAIGRMNRAIDAAFAEPAVKRVLADLALDPLGGPPEALAERIRREREIWSTAGRRLGLAEG